MTHKILFTAGLALATFSAPAVLAQIPQDNDFVKKYPYFSHIDGGDLTPEAQDQIVSQLKTRKDWRQEELDQIYARLTSGPIPTGFHNGVPITPVDSGINIFEKIGVPIETEKLRALGDLLWQGKYFNKRQRYLKNRITCSKLPRIMRGFGPIPGLITCKEEGEGFWAKDLKFAAKLYCGQSLLDSRRESVVIDYAYGDDIKRDVDQGLWDQRIDPLAAKSGLRVRDEIRMVRPGFYLGRAHMQGQFVLWFSLEYDDAKTAAEDRLTGYPGTEDECWVGNQRQRQRGLGYSSYSNNGTLR